MICFCHSFPSVRLPFFCSISLRRPPVFSLLLPSARVCFILPLFLSLPPSFYPHVLSRSGCVSPLLFLSRSSPSCVPEQVEDKLITLSLTLSHQQPSFALRSCYLKSTFTLIWVYMGITPYPCIYVAALQPGEINPLPLFTQRPLCFIHHTKEAVPVNFLKSCLGNLHLFFSSALFFLSLTWLSVIYLHAALMISAHTQKPCRSDSHKHTHRTLIFLIAVAG